MNALCILILCFLPLSPDEVVLKSGRSIDGKIIEENDKHLVIEMKYGKVEVSRSQVEKIIRSNKGRKISSGKPKETGSRSEAPVSTKARADAKAAPVRKKPPKKAPNGPAAGILSEFEREVKGKTKMDNDLVNAYRKRLMPLGNPCIPDLAYEIHYTSNWMVRHLAVSTLRQMQDPDAIPALIDALNDRTLVGQSFGGYADARTTKYYIRQNAALALKEIGKEAIFALRDIAEDPRHPDYENAVYALSKADGPIVEDILQKIARDTSKVGTVRLDAAWGIAGRSDESNKICISMLKDRKLCEDVARALKRSRDQSMIPHLLALVREVEQNYDTAVAAAELINAIALKGWHPVDMEDHIDYFMLANQGSRRSIDRKIGKKAIPRITWWAESKFPGMRLNAVEALGGFKRSEAGDLLMKMVDDPDKEVRYKAIVALKVLRDYRVMESLIHKLDKDPINQLRYLRLLRDWTAEDFETDSSAWLKWWQENKYTFNR